MRVGVLGPLLAEGADGETTPRGQRPRDVLAVLLQRRGHIVTPDTLLDLVWGEAARELTPSAVHTVVARLRRTLGSGSIETHDAGYRLGRDLTLDADDFDAHTRAARAAERAGRIPEAIAAYRDALAVWRGPHAFEGVTDDLVMADRARLDDARLAVVEQLAAALTTAGSIADAEEALALATGLMAEHPLRERPYQCAMLAASRCGRTAQAVEIYHTLAARLREELGIDPSPTITAVHHQVLAQDPTSSSAASLSPPPSVRAHPLPRRRPLAVTPLVGRQRELDVIDALLTDGRRLITIVGPGGVGKSRLLAELAARLVDSPTREGAEVEFVDLSGLGEATVGELAETMALAFGLPLDSGDPVTGLLADLAASSVIILVDEAEWAAGPVAELAGRILVACPRVRLVVTSRVPLEVLGESRVLLNPLRCPEAGAAEADVLAAPAVQLLLARLADHAPDIVRSPVTPDEAALLTRLARRVDGLPLALELVAGHAATHTLADLVVLGDSPLDVAGTDQGHPPRHRTLRDTIVWSVRRLDPHHRLVLRRLGVFAGSFDIPTARAVVGPGGGDVEAALRALVRDALVQIDRRGPRTRVRLLRTVRDLAVEGLADRGELDAVRRRHREWYAARWRGQPMSDDLLADVGDSYDDYLEALRNALDAKDATTLGDLVVALGRRWLFVEAAGLAGRWLDRVLDSGLLRPEDRTRVLLLRVGVLQQHSWEEAERVLQELRSAPPANPDDRASLFLEETIHSYQRGDYEASVRFAEEMVQTARDAAGPQLPEALAILAAGVAHGGDTQRAVALVDEAVAIIGPTPTAAHRSWVLPKLTLALTEAGEAARAYALISDAIDGLRDAEGLGPRATMLANAGWAALGAGEPAMALGWFLRGLTHAVRTPTGPHLAEAATGAACAIAGLGVADAAELLATADELRARHGLLLSRSQSAQLDAARRAAGPVPAGVTFTVVTDEELRGRVVAAARHTVEGW